MTSIKVSHEIFALFLANQTSLHILEQLPRCDLVDEVFELLMVQSEILQARIESSKICDEDLVQFIESCLKILEAYGKNDSLPKFGE